MGRLIDADKLKQHYAWWEGKMEVTKEDIDTIVDLQPTVEAVPTDFHDKCQQIEIQKRFKLEEELKERHGHWKKVKSGFDECSVCKYHGSSAFKHCPNCGARMDTNDTYSAGHNENETVVVTE